MSSENDLSGSKIALKKMKELSSKSRAESIEK
jgi:hypothetical protein